MSAVHQLAQRVRVWALRRRAERVLGEVNVAVLRQRTAAMRALVEAARNAAS
jgi:hypothetical protein